ncbi:MAG: hypothetical protein M0Z38_07070 [Deltaproteobacteria bacterium]|nr:hypothetical protein [Deltaproteobacteria bacterium]
MKMVNMKQGKKKAETMAAPVDMDAPEYPFGLCLNLGKDEIEKLGLGTPKAGSKFMLHAMVEVKSVTVSDHSDGEGYKDMSLQVTDMALEKSAGMDAKKIAGSLYGKG